MFTHTLDTPNHGVADVFPRSQRATSQTVEAPNPWRQTREIINPVEEGSQYKYKWKIPEGQVYVPRLEPTAPIRLADRNHAHYPSRHCTILKKRWLNDGLPAFDWLASGSGGKTSATP